MAHACRTHAATLELSMSMPAAVLSGMPGPHAEQDSIRRVNSMYYVKRLLVLG